MVFDIKEALKRAGCCCDDNPDDYTYKPKYAINYANVNFDIERLRNRWLDSLSYNYKSRFDFIKKLTFDEIIILRNSSIDVVTTHMYEINKFLKNNNDINVEDKDTPKGKPAIKGKTVEREPVYIDDDVYDDYVCGQKQSEPTCDDIYDKYPCEKVKCDDKWGDKTNRWSANRLGDFSPVKLETIVLNDIATEDFIDDFKNNSCNKDLSTANFFITDPFNKEILKNNKPSANINNITDEQVNTAITKETLLRQEVLNQLLQHHDNKINLIKKLHFEELSIIKNSKKDIRTLSFQELLDVINSGLIGEELCTRFYPDGSFDIIFNSPDPNNANEKGKIVVGDFASSIKEIDRKNADSICQAEDEFIIDKLIKEFNNLYNERCSRFYRETDVGNPVRKEKKLLDAVDFIKNSTKDGYQRDGYQMPSCFYNTSTKDIYTATEPKNQFDLLIDFSTADNKARKNFLNFLVKNEKEFTTTEVKNDEGTVVKIISKPNKPLKFDKEPFDTSAALKRAGVNQSKEEIEDIKRKINYSFEWGDKIKKNVDDIDENSFIESGTLTLPKPGRSLKHAKEDGTERSNKLTKEFNDACEIFNKTIKPLPSFNIKSKRGIYSVSQNNDNISEVEIMAASKLPKVEKEIVTPVSIIEKNVSNKSVEQIIKETTVKLKKFTFTVKSAFQELIK